MPENEFEKQVQQKMDELQFVPSDAVWPEVERQITTRKKRRGFIFWLPLGVLLLGGVAWMYFSSSDIDTKRQTTNKIIANDSVNKNQIDDNAATNTANDKNEKSAIDNVVIPGKTIVDASAGNGNKRETIAVGKSPNYKEQNNKNHLPGTIKLATGASNKKIIAAGIKTGNKNKNPDMTNVPGSIAKTSVRKGMAAGGIETEKINTTVGSATAEKDEAVAQSLQEKKNVAMADPFPGAVASKDLAVKKTGSDSLAHVNKVDSSNAIAKTKTSNKKEKKIQWGVNVNAGASSVSDGFTSLFSGAPAYDAAAFLSNQQPATGNINAGSTAIAKPSDTKRGFSFGAGIFISKPLNKKINLLAGINYAYYSNSIHVGAKFDTAQTTYYALGNLSNYTNRFHFIEIPVAIQIHGERFAFNAGLSFSMLAGTNTLLYNAHRNDYYKDNSLVNKMQMGIRTGFSYRLFPKTTPIEIGPQVNYSLSNIFNKDLYGSKHLFFGGINAKIFLHKK